jgi:hypothetical protein
VVGCLMLATVAIVRSVENYPLFTFRIIVTVPLDYEDDTNDQGLRTGVVVYA